MPNRHHAATSNMAPPPSRPPEHGAQLAFGRTDLSALQRRLCVGDKDKFTFIPPQETNQH